MSTLSQFFFGLSSASNKVPIEILAVGGGGGGGGVVVGSSPASLKSQGGAGAGAGLVIYRTLDVTKGIAYPITIGAGGAGGTSFTGAAPIPAPTYVTGNGTNGNDTTFGTILTSYGGGGGSGIFNPVSGPVGLSKPAAGSAGGIGGRVTENPTTPLLAARSFFPPTVGFNYSSYSSPGVTMPGSTPSSTGGGGAGAVQPLAPVCFNGINGVTAYQIGISTITIGGGGSAGDQPTATGGSGGGGGFSVPNGTANTGGGGSGNGSPVAGSGGSGVLFIRYPTAYAAATVSGNTPAPSQPGYYVYRWNSGPGSITFN